MTRALGNLLALAALTAVAPASEPPVSLFVSPDGRDTWTGRLAAPNPARTDGPLATLAGARDRLRALRANRRLGPVTVLVRGGTYVLSEPLALSPEDSGSEAAPVVYQAFPNEHPVISGGRRIAGWHRAGGGLWMAKVPRGWYFTRLFVNGEKQTRSREPDTDVWAQWFRVTRGGEPEPDAPEGMGSRQFYFPPGTIPRCENTLDVEINSLPSFRYANFISSLESVDEAHSLAVLKSMAYYNFAPGDPFRVENTLEAIDEPGEWCLSSERGTVYYLPLSGVDMKAAEVVAPALKQLIRLVGSDRPADTVHDVAFRGLTFRHGDRSRWHEHPAEDEANLHALDSAVYLAGAARCAVESCLFEDVGGFAARFDRWCQDCRFVGNEVVGAGCGGLQAGGYGPGTLDVNHGHQISRNHIHHSSTDFWHAGAVDVRQSGHNHIACNWVHDMPYTGICISGAHTSYFNQYRERGEGVGRAKYNFRWDEIPDDNPLTPESVKPFLHGRDNVVEHNVVHDVLWQLPADGGAIYGFGQGLGNVFRDNLVYRAHCLAIYLDAEFDDVLVQGNVVIDSASPFGGSGAHPRLVDNYFPAPGQATPEIRALARQMIAAIAQAAGPDWRRPGGAAVATEPSVFSGEFGGLRPGPLPGQGAWEWFGPGPGIGVEDDGGVTVAVAGGTDSWAAARHGAVLSPTQGFTLELEARITDNPGPNSSFELYLNAGGIHSDAAFGPAIVAGAQDGTPTALGVRQDGAGPRILSGARLTLGHWYRVRLVVAADSTACRLYLRDLTALAQEVDVTPAGGVALARAGVWSPPLEALDTLVLRLGDSA
ncbi:MAG TPA: hypothetical protein PLQ54_03730, partial [Armatimonadota bacterium]|nr:hypothetical protein [Armatimonadota bacterium]